MITATTWVPRGFAAPFPNKYVFDEDEYDRISKLAKLQLDDAKEDLEEAQEEEKQKKANGSGGTTKAQDTEYDSLLCTQAELIAAGKLTMTSKSMISSITTMTTRMVKATLWPCSAT